MVVSPPTQDQGREPVTRLARMLARYHATRAYLAALIGRHEVAAKHAQLSHLAERVGATGAS